MPSGVLRDICLADDTDHTFAIVNDRQSPNLVICHRSHAIFKRIVHVTCKRFVRHHYTDRELPSVPSLGNAANRDVPVGDHSDQAIFPVYDRQRSAVVSRHQLCGVPKRILGVNADNIP